MSGGLVYPDIDDAIEVHGVAMRISEDIVTGATPEALELIASALGHMQNDDYYPTFEAKLTHLFYSACKAHGFIDGNKRLTLALCAKFLVLNEFGALVPKFMFYMEEVTICVADNKIDDVFLRAIIDAFISGNEDNEEMRLGIALAMEQVRIEQEARDAEAAAAQAILAARNKEA